MVGLEEWKHSDNRKPLIVRGGRQTGKTTLISQFGNTYKQFISLNLEKEEDRILFSEHKRAKDIYEVLLLRSGFDLRPKQTLLFIDEIQESPEAIAMLRYFREELPELHVICAGSLLEFAMSRVRSFPVGRVSFLYLHPMSFREFLKATDRQVLLDAYDQLPHVAAASGPLMSAFHEYVIVGGMPEAVAEFARSGSFAKLTDIYESLWMTYREDVRKYAKSDSEERVINHIMQTAPSRLDERITFQNFGNSNYKSREVGEAFRKLSDARIIRLVYPVTVREMPLLVDYRKKPRLLFLDTGLLNYAAGIRQDLVGLADMSDAYRGALIPHVVMQEVLAGRSRSDENTCFWVREKAQSSAEVDLVLPGAGLVIPVEVKSGPIGKLRSLHSYMEDCPHDMAVRLWAGKLEINQVKTPVGKEFRLLSMPYYLAGKIESYVKQYLMNKS